MYVVEVPTNRPVVRIDKPDSMYLTLKAKFEAIADDIKERHLKGQPVLIGTISIETSELLSGLLKKRGIPHDVLNAKQHEREADIIAKAGQKGAVTIATNMAGRGTDIKLGEGVVELGGLAVIGTERHESRRIDNQLRGRSGRQGDPGYTKFYLSAEDDLMRRFGSDRFRNLLAVMVNQKDGTEQALESKMFSKFVESAQKKIEGNNFDSRKNVLEYDEVLRKQREIIYGQRSQILFFEDMGQVIRPMMYNSCSRFVDAHLLDGKKNPPVDAKALAEELDGKYFPVGFVTESKLEGKTRDEALEFLIGKCEELLQEKISSYGNEMIQEFLKVVLLRVVDTYWMEHIDAMSELRQAVRLQAYAQINPLREYQEIGFEKFDVMIMNIENDAMRYVNRAQIRDNLQREAVVKNTIASDGKEETVKRKPVKADDKTGRNDPCPCGSGKKYKNCHGR